MTGRTSVRCLATVAIAVASGAWSMMWSGVLAQDAVLEEVVVLEVLEPRPLARAIRELENRFGWVITFEDPEYESQSDLEYMARAQRPSARSTRLLVPRTKVFRFSYDARRSPRPDELIPAMVRRYEEDGNTDAYRVVRDGEMYHALPIRSADAKGVLTARRSRLEARVTVENRSRTVLELLTAVLDQVSAKSGRPIALGLAPSNILTMATVSGGAQDERARDVIVRGLAATDRKLSWQIFCGPALQPCMFNVHVVPSASEVLPQNAPGDVVATHEAARDCKSVPLSDVIAQALE